VYSLDNGNVQLYHGDCLEVMPTLESKSIQFVFADLPYGKTANSWDLVISFECLWKEYSRLCVGACVFTASNGFEYVLYNSNPKHYRYKWVWNKNNSAGFLMAKKRPMNCFEDILVFGNIQKYNPQMEVRGKPRVKGTNKLSVNYNVTPVYSYNNTYYPKAVLTITNNVQRGKLHPTQKPVALMEYLIKTYTNEGDIVLDNTMGSGTTGVACINTNRRFIGIEMDETYFQIAVDRCTKALQDKAL